jgi:tRNA pseudouridine55 synthase
MLYATSPAKLEGILLVNKQVKKTSFSVVGQLRRILGIAKIGHTGTLDPFATGLMVMLVGKNFTRQAPKFLYDDKEYEANIFLGATSNTFDPEGVIEEKFPKIIPTREEIENVLLEFQGTILQKPPMFSAKKVDGQKLYHLARKGIEIERESVSINVKITLLSYEYPNLHIHVTCSKGTYIRSLAHDIGEKLGCGGYLSSLVRLRSGAFHLKDAIDQETMEKGVIMERLFWL